MTKPEPYTTAEFDAALKVIASTGYTCQDATDAWAAAQPYFAAISAESRVGRHRADFETQVSTTRRGRLALRLNHRWALRRASR